MRLKHFLVMAMVLAGVVGALAYGIEHRTGAGISAGVSTSTPVIERRSSVVQVKKTPEDEQKRKDQEMVDTPQAY